MTLILGLIPEGTATSHEADYREPPFPRESTYSTLYTPAAYRNSHAWRVSALRTIKRTSGLLVGLSAIQEAGELRPRDGHRLQVFLRSVVVEAARGSAVKVAIDVRVVPMLS